jgi:hypothetical protein
MEWGVWNRCPRFALEVATVGRQDAWMRNAGFSQQFRLEIECENVNKNK